MCIRDSLNAMKHFSYDPFAVLGGRDACTVGALRARAVGHDISIQAKARQAPGTGATKASDLAKMASSRS